MNMDSKRRPHGTGALLVKKDNAGNEAWYGQFRVGGKLVKRKLGPKRAPGGRTGMTKTDAEKRLRALMTETKVAPSSERLTVADAGERWMHHVEAKGRKRSTVEGYRSVLRVHLGPWFGGTAIDRVTSEQVEAFIADKLAVGLKPKTVNNAVGVLHSVFDFAMRRRWVAANPCKLVETPELPPAEEIRFLRHEELEAVLRSPRHKLDLYAPVDRVMYLTAAYTGMRQGELVALRWRDVDWLAGRVRVRRSYVRGEFTTPKSRRGVRAVPLHPRVARELELLFQRSRFQADDDLVFGHPQTGKPLTRSKLYQRFIKAVKKAGVRPVRFHDLRHTYGTMMAGQGTPMRKLQEFMGHRDFATTLRYADYAPAEDDAAWVQRAFPGGADSAPLEQVGSR